MKEVMNLKDCLMLAVYGGWFSVLVKQHTHVVVYGLMAAAFQPRCTAMSETGNKQTLLPIHSCIDINMGKKHQKRGSRIGWQLHSKHKIPSGLIPYKHVLVMGNSPLVKYTSVVIHLCGNSPLW